jgi:2,3-bisphosphoglycerate-independent phosphoglycerate mutase
MSAGGVADALVGAIESGTYDFIVANFANPDMVGHTGVWDATVEALGTIDACIARIVAALDRVDAADTAAPGSLLVITADHGNAEVMRDRDGRPVTAHSLNPVPVVVVGRAVVGRRLHDGVLADVAPTILELAGLERWDGMTGTSLLEPTDAGEGAAAGTADVSLPGR